MTKEKWLPIKGYESIYEVSSFGRVRSIDRELVNDRGKYFIKGKTLLSNVSDRGYERVCLSRNNKQKMKRVHRLVAEAFIPNPDKLTEVNHKNEIKNDNNVNNLEWVTPKRNSNYGNRNRKLSNIHNKPVIGINRKTGEKIIFSSTRATVLFGFSYQSVAKVARGEREQHKGFAWRYIDIELARELLPVEKEVSE